MALAAMVMQVMICDDEGRTSPQPGTGLRDKAVLDEPTMATALLLGAKGTSVSTGRAEVPAATASPDISRIASPATSTDSGTHAGPPTSSSPAFPNTPAGSVNATTAPAASCSLASSTDSITPVNTAAPTVAAASCSSTKPAVAVSPAHLGTSAAAAARRVVPHAQTWSCGIDASCLCGSATSPPYINEPRYFFPLVLPLGAVAAVEVMPAEAAGLQDLRATYRDTLGDARIMESEVILEVLRSSTWDFALGTFSILHNNLVELQDRTLLLRTQAAAQAELVAQMQHLSALTRTAILQSQQLLSSEGLLHPLVETSGDAGMTVSMCFEGNEVVQMADHKSRQQDKVALLNNIRTTGRACALHILLHLTASTEALRRDANQLQELVWSAATKHLVECALSEKRAQLQAVTKAWPLRQLSQVREGDLAPIRRLGEGAFGYVEVVGIGGKTLAYKRMLVS